MPRGRDAPGAAEGPALSPSLSWVLHYCFLGGRHRSVLPGRPRAALFIYLRQQAALIPAGGVAARRSRISLRHLPRSRLPLIESCLAKPMGGIRTPARLWARACATHAEWPRWAPGWWGLDGPFARVRAHPEPLGIPAGCQGPEGWVLGSRVPCHTLLVTLGT